MEALASAFATETSPLTECRTRKNGIRVCIIGGGGTGLALAYDLAQRGFSVTLIEKGELTSGTTGRHHGQLHCGARYAWADAEIARECRAESLILSRIASQCIEFNGGLFVAMEGEDPHNQELFADRCHEAGIPIDVISKERLGRLEPALSKGIRAAAAVPDASFDAFRLALMFAAAAKFLGATIEPWHEVIALESKGGRVVSATVRKPSGHESRIEADFFVNAAGAWSGKIVALCGLPLAVTPAPGALVAVRGRLVQRVVSRMRPPGDGDIIVPQRGLTIIGTTQRVTDNPDAILPTDDEVRFLLESAAIMVPEFCKAPVHAAWAAARPLAGDGRPSLGRALSRDFRLIDHEAEHGQAGLATIIGGKATVARAMAKAAADWIGKQAGKATECRTDRFVLPSWRDFYRSGET